MPSNKKSAIRVLHVDDDLGFLEVSKQIILMENDFEIDNVSSVDEAFKKMEQQPYDAVVSDYEMPQKNGLEFLKELREKNNQIPFILFTGKGREDVAVKALNLGVDSYINKNGSPETVYCELVDAICKTLERKKSRKLLAASESKYRLLVEKSLQGIMIAQGVPPRVVFANASIGKMLGYSLEEFTSLSPSEVAALIYHEDRTMFFNRFKNRLDGKEASDSYEFRAVRKDGSIVWMEAFATLIEYDGQPAVQAMFLDINERKKAEEETQSLAKFPSENPNPVLRISKDGTILFLNKAAQILINEHKPGEKLRFIELIQQSVLGCLRSGLPKENEVKFEDKTFSFVFAPIPEADYVNVYGQDVTERNRMAEALQESEMRLRSIVENSSDQIFMLDRDCRFLLINRVAADLFGLVPKEVVGRSISEIFPEIIAAQFSKNIKNVIDTGQSMVIDEKMVVKGRQLYNSTSLNPVRNDSGKVIAVTGIVRDITERKKAEEELRESEESFRSLIDSMDDLVFVLDLDGIFKNYHQPSHKKELYVAPEEFIGKHFLDVLPPQVAKLCQSALKRIEDSGETQEFDYYLEINGEKSWYNARLSPTKDQSGRKNSTIVVRDITERKKAEKALDESETKFRMYVENSPVAVFVANTEGKYEYVNESASKLLGYSTKELLSMSIPHVIFKQEHPTLNGFAALQETGKILVEVRLKKKDGQAIYVSLNAIKLPNGKLIAFCQNITERKKNEATLRQSEEQFRQLFSSMPSGVAVYEAVDNGEDFVFKDFNAAAEKIEKINKDDVLGKRVTKVFAGVKSFGIFEVFQRVWRTGQSEYFPAALYKNDNKELGSWRENWIYKLPNGNITAIYNDITERKKSEEELKESEEKFRNLSEESPNMIFIYNKGRVIYANKKCEEILHYKKEELYSLDFNFLSLVAPSSVELLKSSYSRHVEGEEVSPYEYKLVTREGKEIPAILTSKLIKYEGDNAILGIVTDMTERKNVEEKLMTTEKRYHALFERGPLGILVIDPETTKPVEFNDVAHAQLGYSREEFSKLRISDFEAKEKADEINTHLERMVMQGGDEFQTKHRTKNGEIRNVLVNTSVVELAGKPFLCCVFHDITEIRKVQEALMKSETQYRQLVNVSQEGIWALDSNDQTVFVNPRMAKMLGYAESEIVGKSLFEFLDKKIIEQAKQFLGKFKQGANGHFETHFVNKNGSLVYAGIEASVIKDDEGKLSGILAMVSDITYRKALEAKVDNYSKHLKSMVDLRTVQLKDANERLVRSERLAAIGELAGMVGHDLRNPLAGIKNAAYYLKKKGKTISEAQAKEMLEIIDKAIDHSNKIINDLLDYSREMHPELTKYVARTLVDEAIRMIQVPDRIQIVNHVHKEIWIWVDSDKMTRVFINLIKNAIDAVPEKGTLEINSRQTKDNVEIAFADTGTGIPEETLRKIFVPLFTTKAQGMGFGLAICKRIVESHGGTITVKTEVNKGTTFTITLPIKPKLKVKGEKLG